MGKGFEKIFIAPGLAHRKCFGSVPLPTPTTAQLGQLLPPGRGTPMTHPSTQSGGDAPARLQRRQLRD